MNSQDMFDLIEGMTDYYDEETLKKQYRIMSRKYHPDNCKQNGINENLLKNKLRKLISLIIY